MAKEEDQEFLEYVVKGLVDNPDKVKVERKVDEMGVLLTLDVAADDMGKIIGRSGNTAKAIRTLLRVVGMKNDARVNLKINEPEGGTGGRSGSGDAERSEVTEEAPTTNVAQTEDAAPADSTGSPQAKDAPDTEEERKAASKSVDEAMNDLGL